MIWIVGRKTWDIYVSGKVVWGDYGGGGGETKELGRKREDTFHFSTKNSNQQKKALVVKILHATTSDGI